MKPKQCSRWFICQSKQDRQVRLVESCVADNNGWVVDNDLYCYATVYVCTVTRASYLYNSFIICEIRSGPNRGGGDSGRADRVIKEVNILYHHLDRVGACASWI
jgi:hypothetical protein